MNKKNIGLDMNVTAYDAFAELVHIYKRYDIGKESKETLLNYVSIFNRGGMPLPSGRWGDPLAIAFEMHAYVSALVLIEKADELNIDLNRISSELGGENPWNAAATFLLSLTSFDSNYIDDDDKFYNTAENIVLKDLHNARVDASNEIASHLEITQKTQGSYTYFSKNK